SRRAGTLPEPALLVVQFFFSSDAADVRGLKALRSLHDLELHPLTFTQRTEPLGDDRRVMHEHIRCSVPRNEPEPLGIIEPLHSPLFHDHTLLLGDLVDVSCRFPSASRPSGTISLGRIVSTLRRLLRPGYNVKTFSM